MQTTDGHAITTIEQDGEYAGQDLGRLWFKRPDPRTNAWYWFSFATSALRDEALTKAQTMTFAEFDDWADTL